MTITALAADSELLWLRDALSELTIRFDWDDCDFFGSTELAEWTDSPQIGASAKIIICNVSFQGALNELKQMRKRNSDALIVPIVNQTIMPSEYVHPDILPYSLLWSPLSGPGNMDMLQRTLASAYSDSDSGGKTDRFTIRSRKETRQIPYREICYFEARDKRVYLRVREQEIPINETISALEQRLPEQFVRCHKGFIINRDQVKLVDWSLLTICMGDDIQVPISRRYRAELREMLNETD